MTPVLEGIDVHSHFVPTFVREIAKTGSGRYGVMGSSSTLLSPLGVLPMGAAELHDPADKCAALDRMGVAAAVVSLTPHLFRHGPAADSAEFSRLCNDELAGFVDGSPRLSGFATLPLGHPAAAAAELRRAVVELGLRGAIAGTLMPGGCGLDEAGLGEVFATASELRVPLFLHSSYAGPLQATDFFLHNTLGVPLDSALGAARLILSGTLDEFPDLRLLLAHGGGSLIPVLGRLDNAWRTRPEIAAGCRRRPSDYLTQVWVDSVTHDPALLALIAGRVGPGHVLLGSDAPYSTGDPDPLGSVRLAGLLPAELTDNTIELLDLRALTTAVTHLG